MATKSSAFLEHLELWTDSVATGYIDGRTEPSDAILKIATENELTGDQVRRLCEASNHMLFKELFSKNAEDVFDFPVADHTKVVSLMSDGDSDGAGSDKQAELDYTRSPGDILPGSGSALDRVFRNMCPKTAQDVDARYGDTVARKRKTTIALRNKTSEARAIVESRKIAEEMELGQQGDKVYQGVRSMILEGQSIEDAYQFIHNLYPTEDLASATGLFAEILTRLKDDNLVAPEAQVESAEPVARIVNLEHPVAQNVQGFRERTASIRKLGRVVERFDGDLETINLAIAKGM